MESRASGDSRTKVAIIGSVGLPARYGGFETLTEYLARYAREEMQLHVYCSARRYDQKPREYRGARLHYLPLDANGVSSIPYDVLSMLHAARYADVLLVLGVSGCIFLPAIKLISRARIIVNVDGMEWRREKWGRAARWFLRFSERMAVRWADEVIADNAEIQSHVRSAYGTASTMIAYGGDHAKVVSADEAVAERYPFIGRPYAIKVCRIEPENNVHLVLEAFSESLAMPLVVIGNWQSSEYGKALQRKYQGEAGLYLLDPIYVQHELDQLRSNAEIYVHGHSAGGTNPSLVEAMSLGLAVIAFDVGYNRATTHGQAVYFRSPGDLVTQVSSLTEQRIAELAGRMKKLAAEHYTWRAISTRYFDLLSGKRVSEQGCRADQY